MGKGLPWGDKVAILKSAYPRLPERTWINGRWSYHDVPPGWGYAWTSGSFKLFKPGDDLEFAREELYEHECGAQVPPHQVLIHSAYIEEGRTVVEYPL